MSEKNIRSFMKTVFDFSKKCSNMYPEFRRFLTRGYSCSLLNNTHNFLIHQASVKAGFTSGNYGYFYFGSINGKKQ
ncbi:MAG: hypothetical protein B6D45_12155 [Ignavibacteriales bacterium UTCHB3]|nr:MAG: hypothetical protein B6D45_12155 [Ignavibacteriales bacterium UTCHB3]